MRPSDPTLHSVSAGGLDHAVLEWDGGGDTTVLFVHGYLDCGGSWGPLVANLRDDLHCVAPDLRGHGGTAHVDPGSYYHFHDYVRDLRDLVDTFRRERLVLVGHSMGGGICSLFAGTWPDEVDRLVLVEGLGPPKEDLADGPNRMRRWIREVAAVRAGARPVKRFENLQGAAERLRAKDEALSEERSRQLARYLCEPDPDGGVRWRHDPLHRTRTPMVYRPEVWAPFLAAITCPVLTVSGGRSWYRWPDLDERRARINDHRHLRFTESSHMLHHDVPEPLAAAIDAFFDGREPELVT